MRSFSGRNLLFLFVLSSLPWIGAVPVNSQDPEDVMIVTVYVTETKAICPSTALRLPGVSSFLHPLTTRILRPFNSSAWNPPSLEPTSPLGNEDPHTMSPHSKNSGKFSLGSSESASYSYGPSASDTFSDSATLGSQTTTCRPAAYQTQPIPYIPIVSPKTSARYSSTPSSTPQSPAADTTYGSPVSTDFASPSISNTSPMPSTTFMGHFLSKFSKRTSLQSQDSSGSQRAPVTSWRQTLAKGLSQFGVSTTATGPVPVDNIFVPIQQDNILPQIPIAARHPVPKKGIEDHEDRTLQTNKFYANTFLGNQDQPVWTHPYQMWWGRGNTGGQFQTWGMNIGHIEAEEVVMPDGNPAQHYINPPKRQSMILSARELGDETTLTTDTHLPFSVNINLNSNSEVAEPTITFPAVQGMSFVTGGYRNATPMIQCPGRGFRAISGPFFVARSTKYRIMDADGRDWVVYINPVPMISYDATAFVAIDTNTFVGPPGFKGTIQIAKNPLGPEGEALYDKATGAFVAEATLTATASDTRGVYSLSYTKVGSSPLLMFILPHHLQSLDPDLRNNVTALQLRTTTKGMATAVWAEKLTFIEPTLPINMYSCGKPKYSSQTLDIINMAAERDLNVALTEKTPDNSMYYAGKSLAKLATIVFILKAMNNNPLWLTGIARLKSEMARYVSNNQTYPLFYDNSWKGLVSNAGFSDPGADFGNTYYNDHHFHYGYFVYTAATIAWCDPEWLNQGDNRAWTNSLVKDFAESDYNGRDYPFSRSFDWYHGHSWAKGLFESADGKDEESTSEDGFASLAIKLWGRINGDFNMEKRGNLMLAIQARSFNQYFYLHSDSLNHPARFRNNTVTGILFENKVDYATYFGNAPELIHGIHMLPLSPASPYLRNKAFVREEWDRFFSGDRWKVDGGWRGILMSNLALVDPRASWEFFRAGVDGEWDERWIDGGASRSWYLTFAAGLGGAK